MASEFPISYFTGIDVDKKTLPARLIDVEQNYVASFFLFI
jgi:hypothetical protein